MLAINFQRINVQILASAMLGFLFFVFFFKSDMTVFWWTTTAKLLVYYASKAGKQALTWVSAMATQAN